MSTKFTVLSIEALKPKKEVYDISDMEQGLYIRVRPSGVKSFVVRFKFSGKMQRLTLGRVGDINLSEAREMARDAMRKVRAGTNPAAEKQKVKAARLAEEQENIEAFSVGKALETYINLHVSNLKSAKEIERTFRVDVFPKWKNRDIRTIAKSDVLSLILGIKIVAQRYWPIAFLLIYVRFLIGLSLWIMLV
ncbi:Arm DNA-binding domain-containing protein [Bartonella sp. B17]